MKHSDRAPSHRNQSCQLLDLPDQIVARVTQLKESLVDPKDWITLLASFGDAVGRACDRHLRDLVPLREGKDNLYTYLFRCVFARIAAYYYAPPTVSDIEFMAAVMGYFQILDESNPVLRRSLVSVRHYHDYKIGDGKENIDGRQGIHLGLPGVEVM